jgi:uncharacterized protein
MRQYHSGRERRRSVVKPCVPHPEWKIRAYLDIETDWAKTITVIGVHRVDRGTKQWTRPGLSKDELREFLQGIDVLFTYNGARFDLPIIHEQLKIDLTTEFLHRDLMLDCWSQNLYGGLKKVERVLGIHRDTEGVDGLMAIRLWERFQRDQDADALDMLLRYNREDVENLESVALRLGLVKAEGYHPGPIIYGGQQQ